jgi:hypothetical protein
MPQISSTGQLANISREMISNIRYTVEHNAPAAALFESFNLEKGSDTEVFPKAGQVNVRILNEGEEMTNEQDLGITTLSVQTNEVGGYIVVSKRLLNRTAKSAGSLFRVIARQFGDAEARLMNEDYIGLFSALNGGTDIGSAGIPLSSANYMSAISYAKTNKFGNQLRVIHHPNAVLRLSRDLSTIGSGTNRPLPKGFSADILENIWTGISVGNAPVFETGDITRDGSDDAIGVIADRGALGVLKEESRETDKVYMPKRRAWELTFVRGYITFELDDSRGAPITADAANPALA